MRVRGRIVGERGAFPFEVLKTGEGISLKVELPGEPFEYSTDCHCLEPLELLGLILSALEEELGEIKGVFVEEIEELARGRLMERLRKLFNSQQQ